MKSRCGAFVFVAVLCVAGAACFTAAAEAKDEAAVQFNKQIRPVLSDKCFACHGPDSGQRKANLRLDRREGVERVTTPGKPTESALYQRIASPDDSFRMPPVHSKRMLSGEEIALLKRWIEQGAVFETHWAFVPPKQIEPPAVQNEAWVRNEIDRFILRRLEEDGLSPSPEAGKERLMRRLSFDLTGLPPSLKEMDAFLLDESPEAYERAVDRLLSSLHFGERMAAEWLDLARYADTYGYQSDVYRDMSPWRDWAIRAFNENLPYDDFLVWQLAGDLLPEATFEQRLATAFNRNHRQTNEGGSVEEEFRAEYVADRVDTFGTAFLGMTFQCARCHDHKYDPVSQKNYYELFAFFNNIDESGLYSHFTNATPTPTLLLTNEKTEAELAQLRQAATEAETAYAQLIETRREAFEAWRESWNGELDVLPQMKGLVGHYPLDAIDGGKTPNESDAEKPASIGGGNTAVEGRSGGAVQLTGDSALTLSGVGSFNRSQPFSVSLWVRPSRLHERAVLFHVSRAWTDAGSRGYQLLLENGRLSASLIHFWPGNAIRILSLNPLPINEWTHVTMSYDGSSRADGLRLYVNGEAAPAEVVRDHLYKDISYGGGMSLAIGERFRDKGFKDGQVDEIRVFNRDLSPLEARRLYEPVNDAPDEALFEYYISAVDEAAAEARALRNEARAKRDSMENGIREIMTMKEMPERRPTFILERGAYDSPGEQVYPNAPASIYSFSDDLPRNRLGLALWSVDERHPLTARVAANRYWQWLFGTGFVSTPEDFGSQGDPPSHPELLDWLALRLIESGWDQKGMIKLILMSAAYRQDSVGGADSQRVDPRNRLLSRGPRMRLSAEMIRDSALMASGLLSGGVGSGHAKPYQPDGLWREKSGGTYRRDTGIGLYRRSLYTYWKRTSPPPAMLILDAETREVCTAKRRVTNTPTQALLLMNETQFMEAARALAERSIREGGGLVPEQLRIAHRLATSRIPTQREMEALTRLYEAQFRLFDENPEQAYALLSVGDSTFDANIDMIELAASTMVASALLNADEALTKR